MSPFPPPPLPIVAPAPAAASVRAPVVSPGADPDVQRRRDLRVAAAVESRWLVALR